MRDLPDYEWLQTAYEGWEDEEILDWNEVAENFENSVSLVIDANLASTWLNEN